MEETDLFQSTFVPVSLQSIFILFFILPQLTVVICVFTRKKIKTLPLPEEEGKRKKKKNCGHAQTTSLHLTARKSHQISLSSTYALLISHLPDATQSTLCWAAARSERCLAFLAGEHKCWPQDRTLSPLLWVTALLEMWTQDLVAPNGRQGPCSLTTLQSGWAQSQRTSSTGGTVHANISNVNLYIMLRWKRLQVLLVKERSNLL